MKRSVFGILKTREEAEGVVDRLKTAGFPNHDIAVLFPDTSGTEGFAKEQATKAPEGATTGGTTGFVVGGVLGWLAGIGSLAIPGIGPFIAAGPILAALSGAAVGAAIGGIAGALIGMGIPEFEARRYEARVKEGHILISVHADDEDNARRAKDILETAHVEDIATSGEAEIPQVGRETAASRVITPGAPAASELRTPSVEESPESERPFRKPSEPGEGGMPSI